MRHRILLIVLLFPVLAIAQSNRFTIEGNLDSPGSKKVYLYVADIITGTSRTDSVYLEKGSFKFQGYVDTPLKAILFSVPDNNRLDFYIEQGNIIVQSKDSLPNANIRAGKLNEDFSALRNITDPIDAERRKFYTERQKILAASPEKKTDAAFEKIRIEKMQSLADKLSAAYRSFVKNNPDNLATIYAIANLGGANPDLAALQPLFESLSEQVRKSPIGNVYGEKLKKLATVAIGAIAPEFTQADTAGRPVSLKDFRGKYVLIDFWASWCGPCREENPNLVGAFERYKDKNFTVLGVSLDKQNAKSAWLKAIAKDGLPWTQVSDLKGWENEVCKMYGIESVPKNFLVDPDGVIVAKDLRGAGLNNKLAEVFADSK